MIKRVWASSNPSELYRGKEDQKITLLCSFILLGIGLVIGLASFITLSNEQLAVRRNTFQQLLTASSIQFETEITRAVTEKKAIQEILSNTNNNLDEVTQLFLLEGFSAINIKNPNGKMIAEKGRFILNPTIMVKLNLPEQAWLAWRDGWFVIFKSPIKLSQTEIGEVTAEWPLVSIDNYFKQIESMGQTISVNVCSMPVNNHAVCFPSRFYQSVFTVQGADLQSDFFRFALDGKKGVVITHDFLQHPVLAAYAPIGTLGLTMIVKIDTKELYAPIIKNLLIVLPVTLIAILMGLLLLRLVVMPLIRRVFDAEKKLSQSNKLLKASDERYSLAVRGSNAGLWDWEVGTEHIFYSPYLKNLLGYTDDEIPNMLNVFDEHLHPEDLEKARAAIRNHILHQVPYNIEYRLRRKSGEYHWFHAVGQAKWNKHGYATRMAGSVIDITEQKISEQRLVTQYTVTQILSEASNLEEAVPELIQSICLGLNWDCGAIWMVNSEENVLRCIGMWCDKKTEAYAFLEASEAIKFALGKSVLGRVWSSAKPYWSEDVTKDAHFVRAEAAKSAGFHSAFCFPILLKDTVFGVMEFYSKQIESPDEELLQMMASIGPQIGQFFQRKHVESERKKVETLKNEFVSIVSHELRTPLTSIRGSLGLLLGGVIGDFSEKAKKLLDIASNNCDRLLNLINDILDVEKIEAGKMSFKFEMIDITKVIKESILINQMYGEKFGVKVMLTESVSDVLVNVDKDRLLQVMANLISNAVKFSPQGEVVKVTIQLINNIVRVAVADAGSGISLEFQPRIFQKFSQADSTTTRIKGGTGLGLSITKAIIEKFDGTVGFVTKPGTGTTFYFDLPPYTLEEKKPEKTLFHAESNQRSLLICEDDEDQALYLSSMLQTAGFRVDTAGTVSAARDLLAKNTYHALLLDLILPDQDGIAFIRELRTEDKTKNLPIIVISVIAQTGKSLLNGDAFSVVDWLDKPIDFSKLLKDVQSLSRLKLQMTRILHVEDEEDTRTIVKSILKNTAEVICASTLQEAKVKLIRDQFDLVILDLMLPDGNGLELLPLLAKLHTPVLVFSAVELDREHAKFVHDALVKSETSYERLLETIEQIIQLVS